MLEYLRYVGACDKTAKEVQTFGLAPWLTDRFRSMSALFYEENKTLAIQVAVLQDIVATHIATTISRDVTEPSSQARFRRQVRSYTKLIELLKAMDADGAERHWRAHLEAAAKSMSRMVPMDRQVVDLFS